MQPLRGLTVVALEHAIAAPFATLAHTDAILAELGVDRAVVAALRAAGAV